MKANLPSRLPNSAPIAQPASKRSKGVLASSTSGPAAMAAATRMPYIKVSEFEDTPKYIRNRISREQVNTAVDAVHSAVDAKFVARYPAPRV